MPTVDDPRLTQRTQLRGGQTNVPSCYLDLNSDRILQLRNPAGLMKRMVFGLLVMTSCTAASFSLPLHSPGDGGLALPVGFEAVVIHDGVGSARHLAVTDDRIVYVKLRVPNPKGLVALRDTNGDGHAEDV